LNVSTPACNEKIGPESLGKSIHFNNFALINWESIAPLPRQDRPARFFSNPDLPQIATASRFDQS
jgi:hypothetical protein